MAKPKKNKEEYLPTEAETIVGNRAAQEDAEDELDEILGRKGIKEHVIAVQSGKEIVHQDIISTGSFWFDKFLGGGFSGGSWARFYGDPESGKTSMGLCWAKQWQDKYGKNGRVIVFNAEGRITKKLLDRSGLNTEAPYFRMVTLNKIDVICTAIERMVLEGKGGVKFFFMIDSTDACCRIQDVEKPFTESEKIAGGASVLSAAGKRLSAYFGAWGHFLFFTSQVRDKMNVRMPAMAGKSASGGNAPRFYSSLTGNIKTPWTQTYIYEDPSDTKSLRIGVKCTINFVKTQNEKTGGNVEIPIKYGHIGGIWREYEAMMIAKTYNIYKKDGYSWSVEKDWADDMRAKGVSFLEKIKGEKALLEEFSKNQALVEYCFDYGNKISDEKLHTISNEIEASIKEAEVATEVTDEL